eukprot:g15840.t1
MPTRMPAPQPEAAGSDVNTGDASPTPSGPSAGGSAIPVTHEEVQRSADRLWEHMLEELKQFEHHHADSAEQLKKLEESLTELERKFQSVEVDYERTGISGPPPVVAELGKIVTALELNANPTAVRGGATNTRQGATEAGDKDKSGAVMNDDGRRSAGHGRACYGTVVAILVVVLAIAFAGI